MMKVFISLPMDGKSEEEVKKAMENTKDLEEGSKK
jgi:hypothetical protein